MSQAFTCFRCGKVLPDGVSGECPDGCAASAVAGNLPGGKAENGDCPQLHLTIIIQPDAKKIRDAQQLADFQKAVARFTKLMEDGFRASGLQQFIKTIQP